MDRETEKPSVALRKFWDASQPLAIEMIGSLPEAMHEEIAAAIGEGALIGFSMRIDYDFASSQPTVVYELIAASGKRQHVQTRTLLVPPRDADS